MQTNTHVKDPTLSAYYYTFNPNTQSFAPYDPSTSSDWLNFTGQWGDQQYPDSDPRQQGILDISGLFKYSSGPTGPEDKQLNRTKVCPADGDECILRPLLGP